MWKCPGADKPRTKVDSHEIVGGIIGDIQKMWPEFSLNVVAARNHRGDNIITEEVLRHYQAADPPPSTVGQLPPAVAPTSAVTTILGGPQQTISPLPAAGLLQAVGPLPTGGPQQTISPVPAVDPLPAVSG